MADVKAIYANTDGWQEFVIENYVAGSSADQWIQFGFTNAIGTFSFADITMTDADGNVLYDMATDETMTNGTAGHWWMSGDQFTLDPVVSAPVYAPKRVLSATGVNSEVNAKIAFYSGSLGLTIGKKAPSRATTRSKTLSSSTRLVPFISAPAPTPVSLSRTTPTAGSSSN